MKKCILFVLVCAHLVIGQTITKVVQNYVVIDTDENMGELNDRLVAYRKVNGVPVKLGYVQVIAFKNGITAAKIIETLPGQQISVGDRIVYLHAQAQVPAKTAKKPMPQNLPSNMAIMPSWISLSGNNAEFWKPGFGAQVRANQFLNPFIAIGGSASFGSFGLSEQDLITRIKSDSLALGPESGLDLSDEVDITDLADFGFEGNLKYITILPHIRFYALSPHYSPFSPFVQLGGGLYILNSSIKANPPYVIDTYLEDIEGNSRSLGINATAGFSAGGRVRFEASATYSKIFSDKAGNESLFISAGIVF